MIADQDIQININKNILYQPKKLDDQMEEEVVTTNQAQGQINANFMINSQSILNRSSMMTYSKIVCCICSAVIDATQKGMCNTCAKSEVNITEGITKQGLVHYCKLCDRYLRPPWVRIQMESPDMMSMCLSKIKGLNKVKLVDSTFIWTEPHSKIIKLKLTVQKEMNRSLIETSFIVEFRVEWMQCDDCAKSFTKHTWNAAVQIRQKVGHKRSFMLLEQIILKHKAHAKTTNIKEHGEGVDFYFMNKSQANTLTDFIHNFFPVRVKHSKQLVSHDQHSNVYNYKFTYFLEIASICKDDLIVLDKETRKDLGGPGAVLLCYKVSNKIHLVDPSTFECYEFDSTTYWRYNFKSYIDRDCLVEYMIMTVEDECRDYTQGNQGKNSKKNQMEVESDPSINTSKVPSLHSKSTNYKNTQNKSQSSTKRYFQIATVQVYNCNTTQDNEVKLITVRTHLGGKIRPGEIYLGYDLQTLNINEQLESEMNDCSNIPDVILVKKKYVRNPNSKRIWKLKHLDKDVDMEEDTKKRGTNNRENQYEEFLKDIEEDKEMRKNVNLYKDDEVLKELEGKFKNLKVDEKHNDSEIDIKVDELLDELTLNDHEPAERKESLDFVPQEEEFQKPQDNKTKPQGKQLGKRDRTGKKLDDDA